LCLILRWVRQGAFVLEDLAEIAAINQAGQRMKCSASSFGGWPTSLPVYFPRGMSVTFPNPLLPHA
jgi:hypothetical protein